MKLLVDLNAQHPEVLAFHEQKMRGAETALCSNGVATCNLSRLLAIALMVLATAGCAHPHLYHTQTSGPVPRVGELVLPVAIGIDGPTVRWRCTYAAVDTGQKLTVEQSAPSCDYHRVIP